MISSKYAHDDMMCSETSNNLTVTQERCTELLNEVRKLKQRLDDEQRKFEALS